MPCSSVSIFNFEQVNTDWEEAKIEDDPSKIAFNFTWHSSESMWANSLLFRPAGIKEISDSDVFRWSREELFRLTCLEF